MHVPQLSILKTQGVKATIRSLAPVRIPVEGKEHSSLLSSETRRNFTTTCLRQFNALLRTCAYLYSGTLVIVTRAHHQETILWVASNHGVHTVSATILWLCSWLQMQQSECETVNGAAVIHALFGGIHLATNRASTQLL